MANDQGGLEFLAGLLLGAGVGVAATLLLAPQSGQETRDVIRERGLEVKSHAEDMGDAGRKRVQELGNQARGRAEQAQERGRLVVEEQGTRLQNAFDQGKKVYEDTRDDLKARM